ncbi:hypothetical protein OIU85_009637 [Salix viminalis]|uniref:Uncharacterized protein n=1 Tax=Salix viminalis TaxID=40686 RepID=A0A9Q0NV07_SALVM|nr:hypothetical protein OIU85_009637 [Salix viminalis]
MIEPDPIVHVSGASHPALVFWFELLVVALSDNTTPGLGPFGGGIGSATSNGGNEGGGGSAIGGGSDSSGGEPSFGNGLLVEELVLQQDRGGSRQERCQEAELKMAIH